MIVRVCSDLSLESHTHSPLSFLELVGTNYTVNSMRLHNTTCRKGKTFINNRRDWWEIEIVVAEQIVCWLMNTNTLR